MKDFHGTIAIILLKNGILFYDMALKNNFSQHKALCIDVCFHCDVAGGGNRFVVSTVDDSNRVSFQ
ncbi:MAG: hypothetical protein C4527_25400 [Candidatus Omnitrophota bacterium]|nr:MAG: hypothetical protein C4527_25400 [Candidatus Omnitrophota bacterium]